MLANTGLSRAHWSSNSFPLKTKLSSPDKFHKLPCNMSFTIKPVLCSHVVVLNQLLVSPCFLRKDEFCNADLIYACFPSLLSLSLSSKHQSFILIDWYQIRFAQSPLLIRLAMDCLHQHSLDIRPDSHLYCLWFVLLLVHPLPITGYLLQLLSKLGSQVCSSLIMHWAEYLVVNVPKTKQAEKHTNKCTEYLRISLRHSCHFVSPV